MRPGWWALLLVAVVSGTACTHAPLGTPSSHALAALPAQVELSQVPFYPQEEDQCGPAALAMLLTHAGVPRTPEQMRDEVYLPLRHGSVPIEMVSAVRRAGLTPQVVDGGIAQLLQVVSQGRPVIVLLNLRWSVWPQWHYAVVVGFDRTREEILLHSGLQVRQVISLQDFDRQWASAQRWGLLIRPPRRPSVSDGQARPPPTG